MILTEAWLPFRIDSHEIDVSQAVIQEVLERLFVADYVNTISWQI